jgi:E3 ubiquitin-protein ligase RNF14
VDNGILVKMELAIDLGAPRRIVFIDDEDKTTTIPAPTGQVTSRGASDPNPLSIPSATISHLPPLILDLRLPANYPLDAPPTLLSAYFTHSWLSSNLLAVLLNKFHALWVEQKNIGEGVLWRIAESIVTADFLEEPLRLIDADGRLSITHASPSLVRHHILSYDASVNDSSFAVTTFRCAICFEDRKGRACIRLACDHVYCKDCLRDGWGLAVREGDYSAVRCPDPDCVAKIFLSGKEDRKRGDGDTGEEDVRRVLTENEVARWKWLRVQRDIARGMRL